MNTTNAISHRLKFKSITTRFALASGLLLSLIVIIAATGYIALSFVLKSQTSIRDSRTIQRLVLEMDRGLEESRRLHWEFFMQYHDIGLAKAHELYAQPSIRKIARVIRTSVTLEKLIEQSQVSEELKKKKVDMNLFLSSAERLADISIRSIELVTKLVAPDRGLEPMLEQAMGQLYSEINVSQRLRDLHREMQYFILEYKLGRHRFEMQSAFNTAFKIREEVGRSPLFSDEQRTKTGSSLDKCIAIAGDMMDVDAEIKSISNDFSLKDDAMKPVSESLVALAMEDVENTQHRINNARSMALSIMVLVTFLGLCIALFVIRSVNKDITQKLMGLTRTAAELRKGNLQISVPEDSPDELGELARTFNVMTGRIRDLVDHLEDIVEQRTQELESSNVALKKEIHDRTQAEQEKENLELQLRQAHKMEAIGTLAGGIAHDFNNILAAILGYTEMALDDLPEWNPARYAIKEVLKASQRAKDMIKQILAFSRKSQQGRKPVQLKTLVTEALTLLRASIPTSIDIRQELNGEYIILADPTQIHQVLINLCTNGAQAMEKNGGALTVTLNKVEIGEEEPGLAPGSYVALAVTDQGGGIDESIVDRVFDPYFTTKDVGKGSGMGLSVVHGIIKSHEGLIRVTSTSNQGTAFTVYLPRIEEPVQEISEIPDVVPGGNEHIMVVDDEASMADIHCQRLEKLGYRVTAKTGSLDALETFRSSKDDFDLVLTDQTMPRMTGEQMAKEMLAIRPDIPIIISTGFSSNLDESKAKELGIKAFLMKPIDKIMLAGTIRMVLDESKSQSVI